MKRTLKVDDLFVLWGAPYISTVFKICLDREPTNSEMDFYLTDLNQGKHRIKILEKIANHNESIIKLNEIMGAKPLLKKIKLRETWRKNLKPIRPIYLAITDYEKKQANQRIMLNNTYQLRSMLGDSSIANYQNHLISEFCQPNRRRQFDTSLLSVQERIKFDDIVKILNNA